MRISDWSSDVCSSDLVVVLAAEAGRVEVVAERSSHAPHLVGRDLLALARAAEHDAAVGLSPDDRTPDGGADRRVVDRLCGVGAEVDHLVTGPLELCREVEPQLQPGVVGSDGALPPVPTLSRLSPTAPPAGPTLHTRQPQRTCSSSPVDAKP